MKLSDADRDERPFTIEAGRRHDDGPGRWRTTSWCDPTTSEEGPAGCGWERIGAMASDASQGGLLASGAVGHPTTLARQHRLAIGRRPVRVSVRRARPRVASLRAP